MTSATFSSHSPFPLLTSESDNDQSLKSPIGFTTHFIAIHEDDNWAVSNAGFMLLMVDDIGSVLLKSTLLLASAYGVLDPIQLYANVALLAAALWFTYRYFTEVWPNREKVYVPEPWKGD